MPLDVGDNAPEFTIATDGGGSFSLSKMKGHNVIIYFYPKDDTPGCTKEACGFRDMLPDFSDSSAKIIGISKDTVAKHDKFKSKYELPFLLGADLEGNVCEAYGTWVEKSMYGRQYMGIERATFLVDKQGTLQGVWRKVKVKGHVEEVLSAVQNL
ncbi:MAG: thioredoxin-dependent thiol peroxidase [Alphaproteobacteria bacterium]|nr:thioredoxin-dependent thiol peroxidase [Alphaproteobacteria bacterium]